MNNAIKKNMNPQSNSPIKMYEDIRPQTDRNKKNEKETFRFTLNKSD
jgi:hypothetical protein